MSKTYEFLDVAKYSFDELDPDAIESDIRYFHPGEQDGDNIEAVVSKDPHNVNLWLKLAYKKLNNANWYDKRFIFCYRIQMIVINENVY